MAASARVKISTNIASATQQKAAIERALLPELHDFFSKIGGADRHYRAISSPKTLLKIKANPILRRYLDNLKHYDGDHAQALRIKTLLINLDVAESLHSRLMQMMRQFTTIPAAAAAPVPVPLPVPAAAAVPQPQRQAIGGAGADPHAAHGGNDENEEVWEVNLDENAYSHANVARLANIERLNRMKTRMNLFPRTRRNENYEIAAKAMQNEERHAMSMFNKKSRRQRSARRITRRRR